MKLPSPSQEHLETHYADLAGKPFFKGLVACEFPRIPSPAPTTPLTYNYQTC